MNHTTKTILGVLVVIGFVIGALFLYEQPKKEQTLEQVNTPKENQDVEETVTPPNVEQYVTENISTLSTEPEVLGGTFYVTSIEAMDGKGAVSYEDGHNAYTADFTYSITEGTVSIDSFDIRQ